MWPESSSVKAVNLVKKSLTVTEIMNFPQGIVFLLAHPVQRWTNAGFGHLFIFTFLSEVNEIVLFRSVTGCRNSWRLCCKMCKICS